MHDMARTKLFVAAAAVLLAGAGAAEAAMIGQTAADGKSGKLNYGQQILLDSSNSEFDDFPAYTLDDVSFWTGSGNEEFEDESSVYVDVYLQGTFIGAPTFPADGSAPAGLVYLGSSDSSVDYGSASDGTKLTWSFTGITIPLDTNVYLVFSDDGADGDFDSGVFENNSAGTAPGLALVGISEADSNPLFGGSPDTGADKDNRYEASFTGIPEPTTLVLVGLGGLVLVRRRRA